MLQVLLLLLYMNVREDHNNKGDQMFYWVYFKKINPTKRIMSRNFETSAEALKFALRNGKDWKRGEMFKGTIRNGEWHKGKIRIGSNIAKSK